MKINLTHWIILILLSSCTSSRKLIYLGDLPNKEYTEKILNTTNYVIQPDDLLGITVSSLSQESNALFNSGAIQSTASSGSSGASIKENEGYLVDKQGNINFPVLGKVELAGLTREQATAKLTEAVSLSIKKPIINIRFLNFKITVIGEVNHPGTFNISYNKVNVIEAIGLAGDLTVYGERNGILIIREQGGSRSVTRIDLGSKDILNSPLFYLKQNDIVYVEPGKARVLQSSASNFYLPIISIIVSLTSVLIFSLK